MRWFIIFLLLTSPALAGYDILPDEHMCPDCKGTGWFRGWHLSPDEIKAINTDKTPDERRIVCWYCDGTGINTSEVGYIKIEWEWDMEDRTNYAESLNPTGWLCPQLKPKKPKSDWWP